MSSYVEQSTSELASRAFASHAALFPLAEFATLSSSMQSDSKHVAYTELPNQLQLSHYEQKEECQEQREFKKLEFNGQKQLLTIDEYDEDDDAASAICALIIAERWFTCVELAHEMALPTIILEEAIRHNDSSFLLQKRLLGWLHCHDNIAHRIPFSLKHSLHTSVHKGSNYGQVHNQHTMTVDAAAAVTTTGTTKRAPRDRRHKYSVNNIDNNLMTCDNTSATNVEQVKLQDVSVDESFYNALNVTSREHYTILESTVGQNFISILNNTTSSVPALRSVPLPQSGSGDIWGNWIGNKLSTVLDIVNGAVASGSGSNNTKIEHGFTNWTNSYNTSLIDVLRDVQNTQSTESSSSLLQQCELPVDFTNYIHLVAGAYYVNRKENEEKEMHKKRWQQQQQQQQQQEVQEHHFAEDQNNVSAHEHTTSILNATETISNNNKNYLMLPWPEELPKQYYEPNFDVRDEINKLFSNSLDSVKSGETFEKEKPSTWHFSSNQVLHEKNERFNSDFSEEKNKKTKSSITDNTNNLSQEQAAKTKAKTHAALADEKQATQNKEMSNVTNREDVRRIHTSSINTEKLASGLNQSVREEHHNIDAHQSNPTLINVSSFASENDLLETRDGVLRAWCDRVQECLFIHVQHKSNDFFTISNAYRHLGEDASAALHQVHFARVTQLAERTRFVNDILATAALYRRRNNLLKVYNVLASAKRVTNQLNKLENWIRLPERELEELPQYVTLLLSLEQLTKFKVECEEAKKINESDKQQIDVTCQKEKEGIVQQEQQEEEHKQGALVLNQHNQGMHEGEINNVLKEYNWSTLSHLKWLSKFPERLTSARHALEQLVRDELLELLLTLSTETTNNTFNHSISNNSTQNRKHIDSATDNKFKNEEHRYNEYNNNNKVFVNRHVNTNVKTEAASTTSTRVSNIHDDECMTNINATRDHAEEHNIQVNSYEHAASLSYEALLLNILSDALEGFTISAMYSLWTRVKESVTSNLISSEELNDVQANELLTAGTTSSQPTIDEKRTLLRFCSSLRFTVFMQLFQQVMEMVLQGVELVVQRWGYYVLQSLSPALNSHKSRHDAVIRSASVHLFHVICTEAESIVALMLEVRSETLQNRREMELLLRRGYRFTRELFQPVHELQLILPNVIDHIECELRIGKAMQLTGCMIVKAFVKQYHSAHLSELNVILESETWSAVEAIPTKYQRQISKLCESDVSTLTHHNHDHNHKSSNYNNEDINIKINTNNTSVGENSGVTDSKEETITNAIMQFRRRSFDNYFILPFCQMLSNATENLTHSYSDRSKDKSSNSFDYPDDDDDDDDDEDDNNEDDVSGSRNQNSLNWNSNSTPMESKNISHARSKSEIVTSTSSNKIRHQETELEDVVSKSNKLYVSLHDDSGDGRVIAYSVFYVIKLLVEYERHLSHFPSLAYDLILKQSEVLEKYDQLAAYLILGANAIEKGTLKTITATHLCVASQCMALLAEMTERMQQRLTTLLCASLPERNQNAMISSPPSQSFHVSDGGNGVDATHQKHTTLTTEQKSNVQEKVSMNRHTTSSTAANTAITNNMHSNTKLENDGGVSTIKHNDKIKCKDGIRLNHSECNNAEAGKLRMFIEQSFSRVVHNLYAHRNDCFHKIAVLVETKVDSLGNIDSGQEWKIRGNEWVMTMLREVARLMRTLRPLLPQRDINGVLVPLLCSLTMKIRESTRSIAPTDTDAINASRSDVLLFKANVERFGYDVLSCAAIPSVKAAMSTDNYAPHSTEDEVLKWFFPLLVPKPVTQTAKIPETGKETGHTTVNTSPAYQNKAN